MVFFNIKNKLKSMKYTVLSLFLWTFLKTVQQTISFCVYFFSVFFYVCE